MRKYKIIYCFTDKKGFIEIDEDGQERYYVNEIMAYNKGEALDELREKEHFLIEPEIIGVMTEEEQNECIRNV